MCSLFTEKETWWMPGNNNHHHPCDGAAAAALIFRPVLVRYSLVPPSPSSTLHFIARSVTPIWNPKLIMQRARKQTFYHHSRSTEKCSESSLLPTMMHPVWQNMLDIAASETWSSFEWAFCSFARRQRICVCNNHDTKRMITKEMEREGRQRHGEGQGARGRQAAASVRAHGTTMFDFLLWVWRSRGLFYCDASVLTEGPGLI